MVRRCGGRASTHSCTAWPPQRKRQDQEKTWPGGGVSYSWKGNNGAAQKEGQLGVEGQPLGGFEVRSGAGIRLALPSRAQAEAVSLVYYHACHVDTCYKALRTGLAVPACPGSLDSGPWLTPWLTRAATCHPAWPTPVTD